MRAIGRRRTTIARAVLAVALLLATGCTPAGSPTATDADAATPTIPVASDPTTTVPAVAPVEPARLVRWHGPVEALFVHPLILRPKLAFNGDAESQGFLDYFITAREFRVLLEELWRNGWTLVDVHKAAAGTVRVPEGRKPLVLYEDDANYYRYFRGRGLARRLVLDRTGQVRVELPGGALSSADVDALRRLDLSLAAASAEEIAVIRNLLPAMASMAPADLKITGGLSDGSMAVLDLEATVMGERKKGRAEMTLVGGAWKLAKDSWQ